MKVYTVRGEGPGVIEGHFSEHASLAAARAEVRRLLGLHRLNRRRRFPIEGGVEGWNALPPRHPQAYGCGYYFIDEI